MQKYCLASFITLALTLSLQGSSEPPGKPTAPANPLVYFDRNPKNLLIDKVRTEHKKHPLIHLCAQAIVCMNKREPLKCLALLGDAERWAQSNFKCKTLPQIEYFRGLIHNNHAVKFPSGKECVVTSYHHLKQAIHYYGRASYLGHWMSTRQLYRIAKMGYRPALTTLRSLYLELPPKFIFKIYKLTCTKRKGDSQGPISLFLLHAAAGGHKKAITLLNKRAECNPHLYDRRLWQKHYKKHYMGEK